MIKVSVIIPIYNVEKYLYECINSVINQTLKNIEIICVNDGSTDKSQLILENFSKKDKRIKIINQQNKGLSIARNVGLENSIGDYIYFLDSDDFMAQPNVLELMYETCNNEKLDFLEGRFYFYFSKNLKKISKKIVSINNKTLGLTLHKANIEKKSYGSVVWNKMYNKYFLKKNKLKFLENVYYEDLEFTYKLYQLSKNCKYIDIFTVNYRQREGSITKTKKFQNRLVDLEKIFDSLNNFNKSRKINNNISNIAMSSILVSIIKNDTTPNPRVKDNLNYFFKSKNLKYILFGGIIKINYNIAKRILSKLKD